MTPNPRQNSFREDSMSPTPPPRANTTAFDGHPTGQTRRAATFSTNPLPEDLDNRPIPPLDRRAQTQIIEEEEEHPRASAASAAAEPTPANPHAAGGYQLPRRSTMQNSRPPPESYRQGPSYGQGPDQQMTNEQMNQFIYLSQNFKNPRRGHKYKGITIKGDGRVVTGNSYNNALAIPLMADHEYGPIVIEKGGKAMLLEGDQHTDVIQALMNGQLDGGLGMDRAPAAGDGVDGLPDLQEEEADEEMWKEFA